MARISVSKTRKALHPKLHLILIGIVAAFLIITPLVRLLKSPGFGDLENAEMRSANLSVSRVESAIRQRKLVYVNLRNKEARFRWPLRLAAIEPHIGMPVTVEYMMGKSGRIYITKVDLRRGREPRFLKAK